MKKSFLNRSSSFIISSFIVLSMTSPGKNLSLKRINTNAFDASNNKALRYASGGMEGKLHLNPRHSTKDLTVNAAGYNILQLIINNVINRYLVGLQPTSGDTKINRPI